MSIKSFLSACLVAAMLACPAVGRAAEQSFSYAESSDLYKWGLKVAQTYNIAIAVDGTFKDKQIKTITVPVAVTPNTKDFKIWITSELAIDNIDGVKVNHTDVMCVDVEPTDVVEDLGVLTYTLPEGYTVPDQGVYVGYSFTVATITSDTDRYPVIVTVPGKEGGFNVYTTKTYRQWKERALEIGAVSTMTVIIEGDFNACAASVAPIGNLPLQAGVETDCPVTLTNLGSEPIESIGYEIEVDGEVHTGEYTLPEPIAGVMGRKGEAMIVIPALEVGSHDYKLTITTVNSQPNAEQAVVTGAFKALEKLPLKRPLMEEFTGTWCQWCPRGWIAMEKMRQLHPDFVAIAYHSGDEMQMANYPQMESGYPSAFLDRSLTCDPYYGESESPFGIEATWQKLCQQFSPAEIDLSVEVSDDNSVITVNSDIFWVVEPQEADYRIEYVLVGDGLWDMAWIQSNAYSSYTPAEAGIYMEPFCKGGEYGRSKVLALTFNDVALMSSGGHGVEGSVESTAEGSHSLHSYTFDLGQCALAPKVEKYRVVAMLLSDEGRFGRVVNSNKAEVELHDGIRGVANDANVVAEKYFDLSGREIANPAGGIYVKSVRYSDGTVRNSLEK